MIYIIPTILGILFSIIVMLFSIVFYKTQTIKYRKFTFILTFFWGFLFLIATILVLVGFISVAKIVAYALVGLSFLILFLKEINLLKKT